MFVKVPCSVIILFNAIKLQHVLPDTIQCALMNTKRAEHRSWFEGGGLRCNHLQAGLPSRVCYISRDDASIQVRGDAESMVNVRRRPAGGISGYLGIALVNPQHFIRSTWLLCSYPDSYRTYGRVCKTDFVLNHKSWLVWLIVNHIQNYLFSLLVPRTQSCWVYRHSEANS